MARFVLPDVLAKKLLAVARLLVSASLCTPLALAQHTGHPIAHPIGGGHPGVGSPVAAPHVANPPVFHAPILHQPMPQPRVVVHPPTVGAGVPNFGFRHHPFFPIGRPIFIRPFFGFRPALNSLWWLNCGPLWGWESACDGLFLYPYRLEPNVTPPLRYESPVYVYRAYAVPDNQLVELFLKDGTTIAVADYWFVNDEIRFLTPDEDAANAEQAIGLDELDLQKTIDVNTRRGFRFVRRDAPMDQWLRDHPNSDPPLVQPPQKN